MFTTLPVAFLSGYIQNAPAQASENSRPILITAKGKPVTPQPCPSKNQCSVLCPDSTWDPLP